jgi:hypothetical protein
LTLRGWRIVSNDDLGRELNALKSCVNDHEQDFRALKRRFGEFDVLKSGESDQEQGFTSVKIRVEELT